MVELEKKRLTPNEIEKLAFSVPKQINLIVTLFLDGHIKGVRYKMNRSSASLRPPPIQPPSVPH